MLGSPKMKGIVTLHKFHDQIPNQQAPHQQFLWDADLFGYFYESTVVHIFPLVHQHWKTPEIPKQNVALLPMVKRRATQLLRYVRPWVPEKVWQRDGRGWTWAIIRAREGICNRILKGGGGGGDSPKFFPRNP